MSARVGNPLSDWIHVYSGKVRDIYVSASTSHHHGRDTYLVVASDRIAAFNTVLPTQIPHKGEILTKLSLWWFERLADLIPNHVISTDVPSEVAGRAMVVKRLEMFPIECIVRGYLAGDAFRDYVTNGTVAGNTVGEGLVEASRLAFPVFTPTTKSKPGECDESLTFEQVYAKVGGAAHELRSHSMMLYEKAHEIALSRGVIIADSKFEFGTVVDSGTRELVLGDELFTPDSSRLWFAKEYEPGHRQASFDKELVCEWLTSPESGWDPSSSQVPPELPQEVVERTRERYIHAYETLTGERWQ